MTVDLPAAADFMAANARMLDRRRFRVVLGEPDHEPLLSALGAYRNPDGGYGWGLEPDLRDATSQPGCALHAFEVFADIAPSTNPRAVELCDWLASVTLPDGGLPFALPVASPAGCAPFWAEADPRVSSLQITAVVAEMAHRVARTDVAVAGHPWLARATDYCVRAAKELDSTSFALTLVFTLRLLDAAHGIHPEAARLLESLAALVPRDGIVPVVGGTEGEAMRPLDIAPEPGRPLRDLLAPEAAADLRRLADAQLADGGWDVDFRSYSPAAALDWRGHVTVQAVTTLRANGLL
jgi:hypothetical protein